MKAMMIVIAISGTGEGWHDLTNRWLNGVGGWVFPTMEACQAAVSGARMEIAKDGDAEAGIVLVCVPATDR